MSRPPHPVTAAIDAAIDLVERHDGDVTPQAVEINTMKRLVLADWSPDDAMREALKVRIQQRLRSRGYVISNTATRVRTDFWASTIEQLEALLEVKQQSSRYDANRLKADRAVVTFLKEKEAMLGYEVYPGLFQADIDRIYAMHSVSAP